MDDKKPLNCRGQGHVNHFYRVMLC